MAITPRKSLPSSSGISAGYGIRDGDDQTAGEVLCMFVADVRFGEENKERSVLPYRGFHRVQKRLNGKARRSKEETAMVRRAQAISTGGCKIMGPKFTLQYKIWRCVKVGLARQVESRRQPANLRL
nr:hypothetical protein Iba_chr11cCG1160 [Ipomoea batatas]